MKVNLLKLTKISWKLTILYAFIFSMVLILLNAAILYGVQYFLVQQASSEVDSTSTTVIKKIIGTKGEQTALTDPELVSVTQNSAETFIKIALPNGQVISTSKKLTVNEAMDQQLGITRQLDITESRLIERHFIIRNDQVQKGGQTIAYVQVLRDMGHEYRFIELLIGLIVMADLFGIIISVIAGYILSKRMLNPIDRIARTAQSISISDLSGRIEVENTDDEIGRLALTFNDMIGRLQLAFEKQNQFVADASHELKTPISIIQGYINLMDRWGKGDKEILQESITAIKKETIGMKDLIEKLLFLAGGDSDSIILHKETFSLEELLKEVISESRLIASDHQFRYQMSGPLEINADRKMLKQMFRALLDNSIKYTPTNGEISISADDKAGQIQLVVSDTGIGVPKEELENIFTRFYRVDKSRGKESGGSGLGLAIVKWIVDVHGGQITTESVVGIGTTIIIRLPGD